MNTLFPPACRPEFEKEFLFLTSRSSGPGGQNVNKTETKVELRFHVNESSLLNDHEKSVISTKLKGRINSDGFLQIIVQESRSQLNNKEIAIERFFEILTIALTVQKKRKPSRPTKASVTRRLDSKTSHSRLKALRRKVD